ncbi:hypothetical protein GF371_04910 [Candidatus Woesearchaeota archaeon]|nr:hypothetical protein [Candidatus Woesearchaeota archaeon]
MKITIPIVDIANIACAAYAGYSHANGSYVSPAFLYGPVAARTAVLAPLSVICGRGMTSIMDRLVDSKAGEMPAKTMYKFKESFEQAREHTGIRGLLKKAAKEFGLSSLETAVGYGIGHAIGRIS